MTARIPFALVGVVLLVGSATLAGSIGGPVVTEPALDRELERVTAETQSALRDAVTAGAREAARNPVLEPAETEYGAVLNETTPFRDTLRVRIYLQVLEAVKALSSRHHGIETSVALHAPETPRDLRSAKQQVHLDAHEGGNALTVTVQNLTITATRDGRQIARRQLSPTVTVPTPVLAVHDRVSQYENRLNRGPLQPGLGRRLTASLYPVVWARGYAQYGGAPIENVLANRHVALFANRAILSLQTDIFGHSDPVGRAVFKRAFAQTALSDALGGIDTPATTLLQRVHDQSGLTPDPVDALGGTTALENFTRPSATTAVGVNETADRIFLAYLDELSETLESTYTARVELRSSIEKRTDQTTGADQSIPDEWTLRRTRTATTVTVNNRTAAPPSLDTERHLLEFHPRTVRRTTTTTRLWEGPNRTQTTTERRTETFAVDLVLVGTHFGGPAPVRPIQPVHEPGGPLTGPNLVDILPRAHDRLITAYGGADDLARQVIAGEVSTLQARISGERPAGLRDWVYRDLANIRDRVANISVTTTRGELATLRANPARALASRLRQRRPTLADVPTAYDGVAHRARVAARLAYLERVIDHFERRARNHTQNRRRLNEALTKAGGHPLDQMATGLEQRETRSPSSPLPMHQMRVNAAPGYLTTSPVGRETLPALDSGQYGHPLVARNWNAITLPYGNIADTVVAAILGPKKTRLRSAAQVLDTIERSTIVDARDIEDLHTQVSRGIDAATTESKDTLAELQLGDEQTRAAVVSAAIATWRGAGARALAVANDSFARRVHTLAVDRWGDTLSTSERDLLGLRLERAVADAIASNRPNEPPVTRATTTFRNGVRTAVSSEASAAAGNLTKQALERLAGRNLRRLPAGLPVAPAPGLWYATVNLWQVRIRGEYIRFAVSVPRGTPDNPGARLRYVRDGSPVRIDVDDDGQAERLGRAPRVSFSTGTDVAIAVPPGACGVGDIDGQAHERSDGWPTPGGW